MPIAEETNVLRMWLANGALGDLYPWDLVLEEGFSQLYRAELTALSDKKHTMKELSDIVDNGISITIREKLNDGKTYRSRYLHGIVSSVRCIGVFCSTGKTDCYTYLFVIEPGFARLRFTCFTAPYYGMSPPDIFEKILGRYSIPVQIKDDYLSRGRFGRKLMFNQTDMSDYDFIDRIARMYGLSFTFTHPAPDGGVFGTAELYFSNGETFPVSAVTYSDKRKTADVLQFDFLRADEDAGLWKMDSFSVRAGIGVDGFKQNAMYPAHNYGSNQWWAGKTGAGARRMDYSNLFHGYDVDAVNDEIDEDIRLILGARVRAADIAKSGLSGAAKNIALLPGVILELRHFYGQKDDEVNTVLLTGIRLHRRARWPADMAVRPEGGGAETVELEFSGIDWGKDAVKRFCPPTALNDFF